MTKSGIKAIKNGRLIDGTGGPCIENATILVEGTTIKAVGKDIPVPKEALIIDATNKTVMPGLINAHMHCDGPKVDDTFLVKLSRAREVGLIKAVFDVRGYLEAGFTTLRSCGGTNGIHLKQAREEFEREFVKRKLLENNSDINKTAKAIGVDKSYLRQRIKELDRE